MLTGRKAAPSGSRNSMVVPMVGGGDAHPRAGVLVDAVAKRGSNRERSFAAGNERSIGLKEGLTATRILLAEDDQILGSGLKAGLGQAGFQVDWVRDGQAAQKQIEDEEYDAVVLDLGLPLKDGLDVLRQARKRGKALPVLVLTALVLSLGWTYFCRAARPYPGARTHARDQKPGRTKQTRRKIIRQTAYRSNEDSDNDSANVGKEKIFESPEVNR